MSIQVKIPLTDDSENVHPDNIILSRNGDDIRIELEYPNRVVHVEAKTILQAIKLLENL